MCGIVGYTGDQQAAPILLAGLEKLEYRGYDSAGLAVRDGERVPEVVKAKGRLRALAEKTDNGRAMRQVAFCFFFAQKQHFPVKCLCQKPYLAGNI